MTWNTTTIPTDRERIRKVLNYPAVKQSVDTIQSAMDRITNESPESITTVQSLLEQIDELAESLRTARSDASYAMIKADVVEWEPGGKRSEGIAIEKAELEAELAATMGLEPYGGASVGGSDGILLRS